MRSGKCAGSRRLCANACFGQPTHSPTIPARPASARWRGADLRYRIRVGDYRVIYEIHDNVLIVLVVEVGNRREVY